MDNSLLNCIGNTPLVELKNIEEKYKLKSKLFAKLEMFNLSGSIKIRIAKEIILDGINKGLINNKTTIIEATSGNTGIALACICAQMRLKLIIVMPENMSIERQKLIKIYGGKIILTQKNKGMKGSLKKVEELKNKYKNVFIPSQFDNLINQKTHYLYLGKEIYNQLNGNIDIFIAGIGTGGTITGASKYLKERKNIVSIGVEPLSSPLINKGYSGKHKIQGIGANFIPKNLDLKYVDKVEMVSNNDAFKYLKLLATTEGIFVGISSGAVLNIGIKEALKNENKNIVLIFPDLGERYLSIL